MAKQVKRTITSWADVPVVFDLIYAGSLLGRSVSNLKLLASRGDIPAFKVCNEWRIEKNALMSFIEQQANSKGIKEVKRDGSY